MQVISELVLGKADPGLREPEMAFDFASASENAALIEGLGFDGIMATETKDDPFLMLTLAASSTKSIGLSTAVAIAFPRSPTSMAMTAWGMQKLSQGRFTLGLGSQVSAHIKRRYGLQPAPLGPWMRDYVGAVRAVWDCWQNGTKLNYESEQYNLNLMVPLFNPGPIEWSAPPIHLAALNPYMCRVAGELADGVRPHPVCTPRFINEIMRPAIAAGAQSRGRDPADIKIIMRPMLATAPDEQSLVPRIKDIRARVAFYACTPAYRPAFDLFGLNDLARELSVLAREQRWEEMPAYIDDDVMNTFAVVGTYDQIADKIVNRFSGVLDQVGFSIAVRSPEDAEQLRGMVTRIKSSGADS
jgi:probable F420-dependent oxidoreductase